MSFILDALKKAESRRGQPQPPVAADTPLGDIASQPDSHRRVAVMLAIASGVLVIASLAWWLGRHSTPPGTLANTAGNTVLVEAPVDERPREIRPLEREADRSTRRTATAPPPASARERITGGSVPANTENQFSAASVTPSARQSARPPGKAENLPGYEEIVLSGRVSLPSLHLDVHVYADAPERRFVFINSRKYRQGEQLDEGGRVERITPRGAVLDFRGHRFELAPD